MYVKHIKKQRNPSKRKEDRYQNHRKEEGWQA